MSALIKEAVITGYEGNGAIIYGRVFAILPGWAWCDEHKRWTRDFVIVGERRQEVAA